MWGQWEMLQCGDVWWQLTTNSWLSSVITMTLWHKKIFTTSTASTRNFTARHRNYLVVSTATYVGSTMTRPSPKSGNRPWLTLIRAILSTSWFDETMDETWDPGQAPCCILLSIFNCPHKLRKHINLWGLFSNNFYLQSSIINTIFCSLMRWWWVQGAEVSHYIQHRWQCSAVQYDGGEKHWGFLCNFNSTV